MNFEYEFMSMEVFPVALKSGSRITNQLPYDNKIYTKPKKLMK